VIAERDGQSINIKSAKKIDRLLVWLDDRMVDLDRPVRIACQGKNLFEGSVPRTVATLMHTLDHRGDPQLMFDAEIEVKLPGEKPSKD
jgi:hypothetical protein